MSKKPRRQPAYLWRSRHGTYYFRAVVPAEFARNGYRGPGELRRSLQTDSWKEAIVRVRPWRVEFDRLIGSLSTVAKKHKKKPKESFQLDYTKIVQTLPDGTKHDITVDYGSPEADRSALLLLLPALGSGQAAPSVPSIDSRTGLSLSALSEKYLVFKADQQVSARAIHQYRTSQDLLIRIIGAKSAQEFTYEDAAQVVSVLRRLPSNAEKKHPGMTINEWLAIRSGARLHVGTVKNHRDRMASFFSWAANSGFIERNPFKLARVKDSRAPHTMRSRYSPEEISRLFGAVAVHAKKPYQFWIPLLGLFTGARQGELAQLYVADIDTASSPQLIHIQKRPGENDKTLKTRSAARIIPIHSVLVELGFTSFVVALQRAGAKRLFEDLPNRRDGYGEAVSKWFNRSLRNHAGIVSAEGARKDFHSFRHTFIDTLKQAGKNDVEIGELVGHHNPSQSSGRYGNPYAPEYREKLVELVQFDLPLDALKSRWRIIDAMR